MNSETKPDRERRPESLDDLLRHYDPEAAKRRTANFAKRPPQGRELI